MGKLNDSLLSGSSGKTGRLVVANVAGTEILRTSPRRGMQNPSPKQILVQDRMKMGYDFVSAYSGYAKQYFGKKVGMRSQFNSAMMNVLYALKLDFVTLVITPVYSEIKFSRGPLLAAIPTALTAVVAGSFTVDWFDNSAGNTERGSDDLQVLYQVDGDKKPSFWKTPHCVWMER